MELNNIKERAKELVKDWLKSIFVEKVVSENENLIEKGLSSIQVMQLSGKLKKTGIKNFVCKTYGRTEFVQVV